MSHEGHASGNHRPVPKRHPFRQVNDAIVAKVHVVADGQIRPAGIDDRDGVNPYIPPDRGAELADQTSAGSGRKRKT
jgi:hypothetical protein